jgi:DNA replication licensing factor MCM6
MSSLADAILSSDAAYPGAGGGGAARRTAPSPQSGRNGQQSSTRLRGPPSESNANQSDGEGFPDDEVVGVRGNANRARNPMDRAIPKVTDEVGERVADVFEEFLEK